MDIVDAKNVVPTATHTNTSFLPNNKLYHAIVLNQVIHPPKCTISITNSNATALCQLRGAACIRDDDRQDDCRSLTASNHANSSKLSAHAVYLPISSSLKHINGTDMQKQCPWSPRAYTPKTKIYVSSCGVLTKYLPSANRACSVRITASSVNGPGK